MTRAADKTAIRPFHVNVPEADLTELRRRINATRWPDRETVTDQSQGVQLATVQQLARYWATEYDWRKCEAKLNAQPQFITEIDGLDIHFIHVRSKHEHALPLIVTHGWPGSVVEQLKIIDPLTNPTAHGASAADAFHVVIPSLPGYGFSGKPTSPGWEPARIARAWVVLMKRLGYTPFVAQGGDWGAIITEVMGAQAPPELLGIHTSMPGVIPADIDKALQSGAPMPSGLSSDEHSRIRTPGLLATRRVSAGAYQMGLRPQTLYGIVDSPVGLAAYLLDHGRAQLRAYRTRLCRTAGRPHTSRRPRQHHADLVDEHGDFFGPSLLGASLRGEHIRLFQRQGRLHPGGGKRLPGRSLSGPSKLGGAGVSTTHLLQQARQRRALCGLGTAATPFRRGSRGLQITAQIAAWRQPVTTRGNP